MITSCGLLKKKSPITGNYIELDTLTIPSVIPQKIYKSSNKKFWDLHHTELNLSFDWENQYVIGEAVLTLSPYFYAQNRLTLDAKGFDIKSISLSGSNKKLQYIYNDRKIDIQLPNTYLKEDTLALSLEYIAKPNELQSGGSSAITSDIGLYFINPLNEIADKPQQIWTQGETEANSCWFPTIDSPNEKMTQEIYLTVQKRFKTLSNGTLVYSTENENGTRTDYWKQDLPHAPYLAMICIGEYAVVHDSWQRDSTTTLDVDYYIESDYESSAVSIFGNTPQMIDFFSDKLQYPYPWDKYHQVVVRDFVSGAMENTSAVIHGEFVQNTERELLDEDHEYIIAHELFHHWFGDLVTCESWANLPLNESFATYGEYLWKEYKYGRDDADAHLRHNLSQYLDEAESKQEDMIRYYYEDREDMFDSHSYAKGGCILHMLRKYVGDEAFYKSLNLYLTENEFQTVEIHDLRIAFEKITGEDLNWFFNQWFLSSGHPTLYIDYSTDLDQGFTYVRLEQIAKTNTPVYKLPMAVDIYEKGEITRHQIVFDQKVDTFSFPIQSMPDLVNVDAEHALLAVKSDAKSKGMWQYQFKNGKLFEDRYNSLLSLAKLPRDSLFNSIILNSLVDPYYQIRLLGIELYEGGNEDIDKQLMNLAKEDEKSDVRASAISKYSKHTNSNEKINFLQSLLDDRSYLVISETLNAIYENDSIKGMQLASSFESIDNLDVQVVVSNIYSSYNKIGKSDYFSTQLKKYDSYNLILFISNFQRYLIQTNIDENTVESSLKHFREIVQSKEKSIVKAYALVALKNIRTDCINRYPNLKLKIESMLEEMKAEEKDEQLLRYY
jgi:aminopeptidase N